MEKTLIESETDRMNAGVKYFRNIMQWLGTAGFIFNVASQYTKAEGAADQYTGGMWDFFETSNGGFFMAPQNDVNFMWDNPDNYSHGEVSPEALGIISCLFAFSNMSFKHQDNDSFGNQYHKLREYAYSHPEAAMIFQAID